VGFPDDRDRRIIRLAEETENLATDMANWVNEFNHRRVQQELLAVSPSDEFELTRLRRLAANLYSSAKVPVAAAVYGPSQVGKSLFVGRMLQSAAATTTARWAATSSTDRRPTSSICRSTRPEPAERFERSDGAGHAVHDQGPHRGQRRRSTR
jgi:hypothetical protein